MMIERVDEFEWIEGTEDDFKIKGASENASEGQCEEEKKCGGLWKYRNLTMNKKKAKLHLLVMKKKKKSIT